ncbi:hypothetical protein CPB85DRAFT_902443 [Mucidula mucida]|nr:hypothetical protein CPB85DRAFT_902443 [Mucidula mucida]
MTGRMNAFALWTNMVGEGRPRCSWSRKCAETRLRYPQSRYLLPEGIITGTITMQHTRRLVLLSPATLFALIDHSSCRLIPPSSRIARHCMTIFRTSSIHLESGVGFSMRFVRCSHSWRRSKLANTFGIVGDRESLSQLGSLLDSSQPFDKAVKETLRTVEVALGYRTSDPKSNYRGRCAMLLAGVMFLIFSICCHARWKTYTN